jgi:hypothetical protein
MSRSFFAFLALAQHSKFRPNNQQIPVPDWKLQQYTARTWGLDDYFETFYTNADFGHSTPRFKERM